MYAKPPDNVIQEFKALLCNVVAGSEAQVEAVEETLFEYLKNPYLKMLQLMMMRQELLDMLRRGYDGSCSFVEKEEEFRLTDESIRSLKFWNVKEEETKE